MERTRFKDDSFTLSEKDAPERSARYNYFGAFVGSIKLMDHDFERNGRKLFVFVGTMAKGNVGLIVNTVGVTPQAKTTESVRLSRVLCLERERQVEATYICFILGAHSLQTYADAKITRRRSWYSSGMKEMMRHRISKGSLRNAATPASSSAASSAEGLGFGSIDGVQAYDRQSRR